MIAGALGSLLPIVPDALNIPTPLDGLRWVDFRVAGVVLIAVAAIFLGTFQYAVLRSALGRASLRATMWIPITVLATLVGYLTVLAWSVTVPRVLLSVQAIHDSLPAWFPFQTAMLVLIDVAVALFVGLAQGVLLRGLSKHGNAMQVWLVANVVAAIAVGTTLGLRYEHYTYVDEATATAMFIVDSLITGGLYAAITGVALVTLLRPHGETVRASPE